jgi:hypothetical protein
MGLDESVPLAGVDTGTARFNPNVYKTTRRSDPATGLQDGPRRHRLDAGGELRVPSNRYRF